MAGINLIIKNTFLDIEDLEPGDCSRRSCSEPRQWKPFRDCTPSSDSTVASDADFSDGASVGETPERLLPTSLNPGAAEFRMPPVAVIRASAAEFIPEGMAVRSTEIRSSAPEFIPGGMAGRSSETRSSAAEFIPGGMAGRSSEIRSSAPEFIPEGIAGRSLPAIRLNPEARTFEPIPQAGASLMGEISTVIAAAASELSGSPYIMSVKVNEGERLGCVTTIFADLKISAGPAGASEALDQAKAALLNAASRSQITYVLGYDTQPFEDMLVNDGSGFKATIGSVHATLQDRICWDTYQRGFCPRRSSCRWCHPLDSDLAPIQIIVK